MVTELERQILNYLDPYHLQEEFPGDPYFPRNIVADSAHIYEIYDEFIPGMQHMETVEMKERLIDNYLNTLEKSRYIDRILAYDPIQYGEKSPEVVYRLSKLGRYHIDGS